MDFAYDDDQQSIIDLAGQMLTELASHERQREVELAEGPRFDAKLWKQLAESGLIGTALPEAYGGAGLGFTEIASVLERIGEHTAPVPYFETVVLGALPIMEFGSDAQKEAWLPRVAEGSAILTAALEEDQADPLLPTTTAARRDGGFTLTGDKLPVPAAELAQCILVPARVEGGEVAVFLVEPDTPGVSLTELVTTSGQPTSKLSLDGVKLAADALLGGPAAGRVILEWTRLRATAALCALGLGVCDAALRMTAEYTKERKQFDQPIAMFQAVGHRAADAFIDVQGIRLTTLQACWRIAAGLPAEREVALAKFWVAEAGQRVVAAAQHLHGGMGVDRDYPVHRFYLYAKQIELDLGGSSQQLRSIGRMLADTPLL